MSCPADAAGRGRITMAELVRQFGTPVCGYFAWALLGNFEWADGYRLRFGLVAVDERTREQRIKASGRWYAVLIRRQTAAPVRAGSRRTH